MKSKYLQFPILLLMTVFLLSGCGLNKMPFNGDITFHEIALTVEERFIRDSTQSNDDLWIFEFGNYTEYIILSRNDAGDDPSASISDYAEYLTEQGADAKSTEFLGNDAVICSYTKDELFCQELVFAYSRSLYAVALRGGDSAGFETLIASIQTKTADQN